MEINREIPPSEAEINFFLEKLDFNLPDGYLEFIKKSNGCDITIDDRFILLWPLTELFELNLGYEVNDFAPRFFLFGSNGGDTAYGIEKKTGKIFSLPFIGLADLEARYICDTFHEFLND